MKFAISAALGAVFILAATEAAAQEAQSRLAAKAEACIADHAAEVARAEPNLASAVDLLVNDLCAPDIELDQRYQASAKLLALIKSQQKSSMAKTAAPAPAVSVVGHPAALTTPQATSATSEIAARQQQTREAKQAELDQARVSPETGEIEGLPAAQAGLFPIISLVFEQLQHNHSPARYRAAAARDVLAARTGR